MTNYLRRLQLGQIFWRSWFPTCLASFPTSVPSRTCCRRRSPELTWARPKSRTIQLEMVPLPDPGAPTIRVQRRLPSLKHCKQEIIIIKWKLIKGEVWDTTNQRLLVSVEVVAQVPELLQCMTSWSEGNILGSQFILFSWSFKECC